MTALSRSALKALYQNGDVPTGTNYSDFIDSFVNLVDTSEQSMAGALNTTELITSRVSAGNVNVVGVLSAGTFSVSGMTVTTLNANTASITLIGASSATLNGGISVGTIVSASSMNTNVFQSPIIDIKCSGSTLATANELGFNVNTRITAVTNGADTGVRLKANAAGLEQSLYNDTVTSANLWPCAGGQINALGSGAAFPLAGNTLYTILHIKASGYAVK